MDFRAIIDKLESIATEADLTPQQQALARSAGFATNKTDAAALAQQNLAAAQAGETGGGASLARPVRAPTGARATRLQQPTQESRDTQFQKELNAMLRIANLPDRGL
jgi:hypothetical protein